MLGRTHVLLGASAAVAATTAAHLGPTRQVVVVAVTVATSKLPDLDMALRLPHRRQTHSLLVIGAIAMAVAFLSVPAAAGVLLGAGTHSLADACTRDGVSLWWPLARQKVHLLPRGYRFRTGDMTEKVVAVFAVAAALWYFVGASG